jgi:hypothetical protein
VVTELKNWNSWMALDLDCENEVSAELATRSAQVLKLDTAGQRDDRLDTYELGYQISKF